MKRRIISTLSLLFLVLLLLILSCAPAQPAHPPTTTPTVSAPATPITALPARQLTPQEVEWNKVIEAARAEGSVMVYAGSDFGGPVRSAIMNAFKEKYGINVSILVGRGQDALQRVKVERQIKKPVGDMLEVAATSTSDVLEANLVDPIENLLPELLINRDKFNYNPVFDPQGRAVAVIDQPIGPAINTNLVKPGEEPQSWFDFLNPKWKGKILIPDPRRGGGGMAAFQALQYYKVVDESYFRKLLDLEPGLWGGSTQEGFNMVARGEYAIAFAYVFNLAMPIIIEGAPLKCLDMKDGLILQTANIMLVKDRPHPNAARLLANWLTTAEGQKVIHSTGGSKSLRKDVGDFTPEKGRVKVTKPLLRDFKVIETTNAYQEMADKLFAKK